MRIIPEGFDERLRRVSKTVIVNSVGKYVTEYSVEEKVVQFDTRKGWSCTCIHGSLYKGTRDEQCWHIKAIRKRIQIEGTLTW